MKVATKLLCAMIVATILCAAMATTAFAAETGNLGLNVANGEDGNTLVTVVADTTISSGQLEIYYDANVLTYVGVRVNSISVDVYAVNTETAGIIKLAWVAPGAYDAANAADLITIQFQSKSQNATVTLSGKVYDADGALVNILGARDTSALEKAIAKAESLDPSRYTEESFAAVKTATQEAKAVLADTGASQAELDAAAKNLNDAIAALKKVGGDSADTGDNILPVMGMMLLSACGMAACLITKKGWWAK